MAEKKTWSCDVCSAEKKETNHWFVLLPHEEEFDEGPPEQHESIEGLLITLWNEKLAKLKCAQHVCGAECAHRLLARWAEEQRAKS